jgi:hypothetical protein
MLLDLNGLSIEELITKNSEVREKLLTASRTGMTQNVLAQLQSASEQISIELSTRMAIEQEEAIRKKNLEEGKDDSILNIGDIEE